MPAAIQIPRSNKYDIPFKIEFENGNDYDLAGKTVIFTVKNKGDVGLTDDDALVKKTVTSFDDTDRGSFTISLTPTDTNIAEGEYKYDIMIRTNTDDQVNSMQGLIIITNSVTKGV